jgi:hypothetical protein
MWSVGGAVLLEVVLCITAVAVAARRLHREIEPARRSFERLHGAMAGAARTISRDAGRAASSRRLLGRSGRPRAAR